MSEADRPWTLLKALAPKLLDKALDARLDADLPFDMLCQRLANLFSHTYSFGDAMEQLQQRTLKQDETLNRLVEDLERLTTVAFPSLGSADKDNTVLYYFIKALPASALSRSLLLQPPDNVQDAVTRAECYLRLCPSTSRPLSPEDAHGRDTHPTSAGRRIFYPPRRFRRQTRPPFNRRGVPFRRPGGQMFPSNHICTCQRTTGRQFRLPADSRFLQPAANEYAPDSYVWQLQDLLRSTYTLARNHLGAAAERQKAYFDRQVHGNPYQLGELVWRFRPVPPLETAAKFFYPWEGPFVVVDVIHPTMYVLRDASRPDGPTFTTHFDKLKPYRGRLPIATADVTPIIPPHLVPTPVVEETVDMTQPDSPADRAPSEEGGM
ncbi:hypothetical protein SprV_0802634000 [Sparganum proliferum]